MNGRRRRGGFSIIELLIAIIIIGVLVAVLIPVVANRTENARQARANADVQNLSEAMSRAAIDTGYYVRLFALNDTLRGDNVPFNRGLTGDPTDRADGMTDYIGANNWYVFPTTNGLFIDPTTGDFPTLDRADLINRLVQNETYYDGTVTWQGPYINWSRDNNRVNNVVARDGIPDDPWGNNYLFFTSLGMVVEPDGVVSDDVSRDAGGGWNVGGQYDATVLGRASILSLGPNGQPGNGVIGTQPDNIFGGGDDIFRHFGR